MRMRRRRCQLSINCWLFNCFSFEFLYFAFAMCVEFSNLIMYLNINLYLYDARVAGGGSRSATRDTRVI